jgi:hypothetical protein
MATKAKFQVLARWLRVLPPSVWIIILVVTLVGGRLLWIRESRPAHEREIAATFGLLNYFSGTPQSDKTGNRITYVATAEVGLGVFLCEVATGQKQNVRELWAESDPNFPDVRVWPWSPDDSSFVYSDGRHFFICDAQTGKSTATVDLPEIPTDLTWVNPTVMVCSIKGKLHRLDRQPDGTWTDKEIQIGDMAWRSVKDAIAVTASDAVAGADADNAADGDETTSWFSGKTDHPSWLQYQFSGPAWAITRYQLTSSADDSTTDPLDWQLLGSNNGADWTVLDNRTNETFSARRQSKQYDFPNETPYWFYRLNVTAMAGRGGNGVRLAEFQLFSRNAPTLASASSESWGWQDVTAAFDGLASTKWFDNHMPAPVWLQYKFGGGAAWALSEYSLTSGDDMPECDPRDWEFQASNDGTNWITLDSQAGQSFAARQQTKSYFFNNAVPYRLYRLNVTSSQVTGQGVQLSELDLGWEKLSRETVHSDDGLDLRNKNAMVTASVADVEHGAVADKVHDQNAATSWFSGKTNGPVWLQYRFNDVFRAISQYKLVSSTADTNTDPRDWQFLASNDGKAWTVLDCQTNQVFTARRQAKRYAIANQAPYLFYRLNITGNAAEDDGGVRLAEFQLWSDDTPTVVSASAENVPHQGVAQAFDGDKNTQWYNANAGDSGWLEYQFGGGEGRTLSRYALTSGNDVPERDPKDWQFQASNDGKIWANLDVRTGQTFDFRQQTKSFSFINHVPYCFYRLNITASQGAGRGLQLAELDMGVGALTNAPQNPGAITFSNSRRGRFLPVTDPFASLFSLIALDDQTIAWGQGNSIWILKLDDNSLRRRLDPKTALPAGTTLRSFSFSKETGLLLLNCNTWDADSLWRFDPNDPSSAPDKIADKFSSAVWINGGHGGGWVARQNNCLMVQRDPASAPVQIVPGANMDGITVSPDGRQLFFLGTTQDEPSAGIWQYDFASAQLKCVAPYGSQMSAYAKRENFSKASLPTASGQTVNYYILPPMNVDQHPHRKYPLVIGDTMFRTVLGSHGPWIPAVAACDAYVVVVDRPGWLDGIENWNTNVMAVYSEVTKSLPIDKDRVFLFGASAETQYMSECLKQTPGLWRGAILLNPSALPDFSQSPLGQRRPRITISAGAAENEEKRLEKYQADALQYGVLVDYTIAPGEGHHFIGNAAQYQRTKAITRFIFEE